MAIILADNYTPISWDIGKRLMNVKIKRKPNETGAGLKVMVLQNGKPVTPTAETVRLRYKTLEGIYSKVDASVSGTAYVIELDSLLAGRTENMTVDLEIEVNGKIIGSPTFEIQIKN